MAKERLICAIDIGSTKVRVIIGTVSEDTGSVPNIIGVGSASSQGLRRGAVVDVEETVKAITAAVEEAERMAGEPVDHAIVSLNGPSIVAQDSRGVIAVSRADGEILPEDVARVVEAAQAVSVPMNRKILKVLPRSFSVDDQAGIKDPVGMSGIRLEVEAHIITATSANVKNLTKCVHQTGIDVDDIIPSHLAAAEAVLSKRQKELGVALIDIGGGSVSIAVFEEGSVLTTAVLPIGAAHVTNDIAIGLRTSVDTAERIKIEFGTCQPNEVSKDDKIDLSSLSNLDQQVVSRFQLAQIIEARMQEVFQMVREQLAHIGRDGMLPAGAVLTGGGSKTAHFVDLAKEVLGLPVQVGYPVELEGIVDKIDDPSYATAIGLMIWGSRGQRGHSNYEHGRVLGTLKEWFKSFLP